MLAYISNCKLVAGSISARVTSYNSKWKQGPQPRCEMRNNRLIDEVSLVAILTPQVGQLMLKLNGAVIVGMRLINLCTK